MSEVTQILAAIDRGDRLAAEQLLPLVYDELRKLAAAKMAQERPGQTLEPTALVHQAYLRLVQPGEQRKWQSRAHFYAAAAESMRRILIENARRKRRHRHGGDLKRADIELAYLPGPVSDDELMALDEALTKLKGEDPVKAELVQLRFFAGMTNEQAAEMLDISTATAKRYWRYSRAWLHREVTGLDEPPPE